MRYEIYHLSGVSLVWNGFSLNFMRVHILWHSLWFFLFRLLMRSFVIAEPWDFPFDRIGLSFGVLLHNNWSSITSWKIVCFGFSPSFNVNQIGMRECTHHSAYAGHVPGFDWFNHDFGSKHNCFVIFPNADLQREMHWRGSFYTELGQYTKRVNAN